ncbi:MAG: aldolase/citrate lyase family protein [Pseudomonadota bacterium]
MRTNALRATLKSGERAVNAWCAIPNGFSAEVMAHAGFDSVTVDLQHGLVDYQAALGMLQAISTTAVTPLVRVPWNEPGIMMKLLDAGAMGIICPMINTKAEAEAFVRACRYAPLGARSFGPTRANIYAGADYWQHANDEVMLLAMVETETALQNLDEILSVDGLDGTYVGPSDLSLSMGKTPTLAPSDETVLAAMQTICDATRASGRIAACHTDAPATAHQRYAQGFEMITLASDARLLASAAAQGVKDVRGGAGPDAPQTY